MAAWVLVPPPPGYDPSNVPWPSGIDPSNVPWPWPPAMSLPKSLRRISNSLPVSKALPGMKCLLPTTGGHGHGRPQMCHGEAQGGTHHQSPT